MLSTFALTADNNALNHPYFSTWTLLSIRFVYAWGTPRWRIVTVAKLLVTWVKPSNIIKALMSCKFCNWHFVVPNFYCKFCYFKTTHNKTFSWLKPREYLLKPTFMCWYGMYCIFNSEIVPTFHKWSLQVQVLQFCMWALLRYYNSLLLLL